mgnify:CR=1 FL=1
MRGHVRTARPDQHFPLFINREPLALNEFGLQVFQVVIIQVKLALERSIGQAPSTPEHGYGLIEDLLLSLLDFVVRRVFEVLDLPSMIEEKPGARAVLLEKHGLVTDDEFRELARG